MRLQLSSLKEPKLWALLVSASLLTLLTPFLGAPFLRLIRNVYGAFLYWMLGILVVGFLALSAAGTLALLVSSVWLVIGLFCEFEVRGRGRFWAAMFAILVGTLLSWQGPEVLRHFTGINIGQSVQESLHVLVQRIENNPEQKAWLESLGLTEPMLMGQVPSMLALVFLMCLAFSMILATRVASLFRLRYERIVGTGRLLDFKVPEPLILVLIFSFLLSFLKLDQPLVNIISLNILQFMVGLYFFQGLAVLETGFLIFRIDPMIKLIVYILIVAQLFFLLSLIGLADFWLDFRTRLRDWKLKRNKQNHGEQK